MSMHEFEDVVEASVLVLDHSHRQGRVQDLRSKFYNLYGYQALWDTGFTHFRVMDLLLRHRFVYRFALSEHPQYDRYRSVLDRLARQDDFSFIMVDPTLEWHETENPEAGYYDPPFLYCDAGSHLWRLFVEAGQVAGRDARAPRLQPVRAIASLVVEEAELQEQRNVISQWYPLAAASICNPTGIVLQEGPELDVAALQRDPDLLRIREATIRTRAYERDIDYGMTRLPKREEPESLLAFDLTFSPTESALRFLRWWFEPVIG
jgi:hypothetical protein